MAKVDGTTARARRRVAATVGVLVLCGGMAACGDSGKKTTAAGSLKAEPSAGAWQTWIVQSVEDITIAPPPIKGSAAAKADLDAVKKAAKNRTKDVRDQVAKWGQPLPSKPWTDTLLDFISKGAKDPPLASRNGALVHVAMYDAVVAAWHWKYEYNVPAPTGVSTIATVGPDPSYPSAHAAIAGAASKLLEFLYPTQSAERLEQMADEAAQSRVNAGVATPSTVAAGLDLGRKAAEQVIAYAKADGSDKKWDGKRPPGITDTKNFWQPVEGQVSPPVEPLAGTWKTWVMTSGSQFRPGPPPAYGSPEFIAAAKDMINQHNNLTPEQAQAVKFYAGVEGTALPAGIVADVSQGDVVKAVSSDLGGVQLTVPRAIRAMALVTVALADAGIASWDTKFTYWNPRPEQSIKNLGLDPTFKPAIDTPRFPAYMSGSSTYAGAAQQVMTYLFPQQADTFKMRAETQAKSRIWAGIHWPYDEVGLDVGRKIGDLVVARAKIDGAES